MTGIAAELRELASVPDGGVLTEEEFTEQKQASTPSITQAKAAARLIVLSRWGACQTASSIIICR